MVVGWNKLRAVPANWFIADARLPELCGACSSLRLSLRPADFVPAFGFSR